MTKDEIIDGVKGLASLPAILGPIATSLVACAEAMPKVLAVIEQQKGQMVKHLDWFETEAGKLRDDYQKAADAYGHNYGQLGRLAADMEAADAGIREAVVHFNRLHGEVGATYKTLNSMLEVLGETRDTMKVLADALSESTEAHNRAVVANEKAAEASARAAAELSEVRSLVHLLVQREGLSVPPTSPSTH